MPQPIITAFHFLRSVARPLYPKHGTPRRERRERLRIVRHAIQLPEEPDPVRHLARELPQDGATLLDRQLYKDHPFLLAAAGEDTPAARPRVLDPVGLVVASDDIAPAVHRQRRDRRGAQLAALAARYREQAHGTDDQA